MKKTRKIAVIGMLTALYFVLSALLKIPVAGNIKLDLGYIALAVGAVYLGALPAAFIGAGGVLIESMLMSQRGIAFGWILMNAIVGFACGRVLVRTPYTPPAQFWLKAAAVIILSMLAGVSVKTVIDCILYGLMPAAKIPTALAAWILDSFVMLAIGIPISLALKKRIRKLI
ncbi:MAG: ECF transporter S component [Clostridia bacterium]|nr:ECF transporter S component [Clostridia bacterium]